MNDFEIIKENLPKIDFTAQQNVEEAIKRIIESNEKFFKLNSVEYSEYVELIGLDKENVTVKITIYWGDEWEDEYIEIPIRAITDENEFKKYVKEKEEEELRLKAEKEAAEKAKKEEEKQKAAEREYKNYLRLKEKYESNGENK